MSILLPHFIPISDNTSVWVVARSPKPGLDADGTRTLPHHAHTCSIIVTSGCWENLHLYWPGNSILPILLGKHIATFWCWLNLHLYWQGNDILPSLLRKRITIYCDNIKTSSAIVNHILTDMDWYQYNAGFASHGVCNLALILDAWPFDVTWDLAWTCKASLVTFVLKQYAGRMNMYKMFRHYYWGRGVDDFKGVCHSIWPTPWRGTTIWSIQGIHFWP